MTDLPYGLWRRAAPRLELDDYERRQRDADEAWDLRHSEEADELDALIGRTLALRAARQGFPDPETGEGRVYQRGCRFTVIGRVRGTLLVVLKAAMSSEARGPLLLKPDWVELREPQKGTGTR